ETGVTFVYDDPQHDAPAISGISTFSKQIEKKGFTAFGIGPVTWIQIVSNLTNTFQIAAATKYSMQYREKNASGVETGVTFVADDLEGTLTEQSGLTTFSKQI